MRAPDVNVLVYAHRSELAQHASLHAWLKEALEGSEPVGLFSSVLQGFIRVVTNPRAFDPPTPVGLAFEFTEALLRAPAAVLLTAGPGHWTRFRDLCLDLNLKGPDTADAHLAALALEHGCEFVSTDSGFARFRGLRWTNPLRLA